MDHRVRLPDQAARPELRRQLGQAGAVPDQGLRDRPPEPADHADALVPAPGREPGSRAGSRASSPPPERRSRPSTPSCACHTRRPWRYRDTAARGGVGSPPPLRPTARGPARARRTSAPAGRSSSRGASSRQPAAGSRASPCSSASTSPGSCSASTPRSSCASSTTDGSDLLWGVLWRIETDWLPFLLLITVLVFAQAGLYARAGAATGLRTGSLIARRRRADHARVRDRNRPPVLDLRAGADRGRLLRARDRGPARELRRGHAGPAARARRAPARAPRRLGRAGRPPPQGARLGAERDRLRVRRRARALERRRRPAGPRRPGRSRGRPRRDARRRADRHRLRLQRAASWSRSSRTPTGAACGFGSRRRRPSS